MLAAARDAMASIGDDNTVGRGTVAFGTFGTPHHFAISQLIARFVDDYPEVDVAVVGRNSSASSITSNRS